MWGEQGQTLIEGILKSGARNGNPHPSLFLQTLFNQEADTSSFMYHEIKSVQFGSLETDHEKLMLKVIKEVFLGETSERIGRQTGVGRQLSKIVISGKILCTLVFIQISRGWGGSTRLRVSCELGFHTPVIASDYYWLILFGEV